MGQSEWLTAVPSCQRHHRPTPTTVVSALRSLCVSCSGGASLGAMSVVGGQRSCIPTHSVTLSFSGALRLCFGPEPPGGFQVELGFRRLVWFFVVCFFWFLLAPLGKRKRRERP